MTLCSSLLKSSLSQFSQFLCFWNFISFLTGLVNVISYLLLLHFFFNSKISGLLRKYCLHFHTLKCKNFLSKRFHKGLLTKRMLRYFPKCSLVIFFLVFSNDAIGTEGGNECIAQESLFCGLERSRRKIVPGSFVDVFNLFLLVFFPLCIILDKRKQVLQCLFP